MECPRDKS